MGQDNDNTTPEISQEELDNIRHATTFINREDAMNLIDAAFLAAITKLKTRSAAEQTVAGNMITVLEGELKIELKKLPTKRI